MRPRPAMLRLWSRRLAADRPPHAGRRTFSFTQHTALVSSGSGSGGGHSWSRSPRTRPQLPFLVVPSTRGPASRSPRYFTTQRRQWLRYEALAFVKYTLYFWAAVGCVVLVQFVVQQEWMERAYPTPHEWTFMSRMRLRGALGERGDDGSAEEQAASSSGDLITTSATHIVDHVKVMQILLDLIRRLEDPKIDGGAGLAAIEVPSKADLADLAALTGVAVADAPEAPNANTSIGDALDIRAKSEPWRRGYYQALLAAAAASEHVDGWMIDRTRNLVCPPDIVVGPSNPHPKPMPPGSSGAPREENCEVIFPAAAEIYLKLLNTRGLTARQQITAALAFANYLEYKQDKDAAAYVYGRAVLAARAPNGDGDDEDDGNNSQSFFDRNAGVDAPAWITAWTAQNHTANTLHSKNTPALSRNLLATLTAYATFQARSGNVADALPLFVSLLQARRSLPPSSSTAAAAAAEAASRAKPNSIGKQIIGLLSPPSYPPPPDDGFGPPIPGARSTCEEAALRLHIGEIIYASAQTPRNAATSASSSSSSSSSWNPFSSSSNDQQAREEGIAWTREAVDLAEEQLHALAQTGRQAQKQQQQKRENGQGGGLSNALGQAIAQATASDNKAAHADGSATCRQCLVAGLDNWAAMVAQLARDEQQRRASKPAAAGVDAASSGSSWWPSWLGLWGDSSSGSASSDSVSTVALPSGAPDQEGAEKLGRWAAEARVIRDRRRRARELIDNSTPPSQGLMGMLTA
ncbi:uncharacterized protein SPSK_08684 [Sporothrix schenckii 1099-18]|uniref:MFS maltose permease n=1 Tax=Sporothrix schenckii 1099-18 TaxID=1397361 RepID=A0A0F2M7D7_SPOSC|nr:uncharacterized protein SPSK_08684 [Sporothrix schenckii 1099-18]KJR85603.1 hypothetical protein SPSK_08684 [Sporothrix schenckii 1099-18]